MVVNDNVAVSNLNNSFSSAKSKKQDYPGSQGGFAEFFEPNVRRDVASNNSKNTIEKSEKTVEKKDSTLKEMDCKENEKNVQVEVKKENSLTENQNYEDRIEKNNQEISKSHESAEENMENVDNVILVDEEDVEDVMQQMLSVVGNMMQQICEQLQVSFEEIENAMNSLSLELSDLLTEEGLKTLFLKLNEVEVSDLIVNEELNLQWDSFMEVVSDVMEQIPGNEFEKSKEMINNLSFEKVKDLFQTNDSGVSVVTNDSEDFMNENSDYNEESYSVKEETYFVSAKTENSGQKESSSNQDSFMNKNGLGKLDVKGFEQKESNTVFETLQNSLDTISNEMSVGNENEIPVSGKEIISQIVEQISVRMNRAQTEMQMQLYPEHLGKIQIQVVSKDGIMTARIVAETEAAKQAIEGGLTNLKESMEQQELKVESIEVMVSTTGFEHGEEEQGTFGQQNGTKSKKKVDLSDYEDSQEENEIAEAARMEIRGSSVSYTV